MPSFLDAQLIAVGVARVVEPRSLIRAVRVDDEGGVVFPAADRVGIPSRIGISRELTTVGPHDPPPLFPHVQRHNRIRRVEDCTWRSSNRRLRGNPDGSPSVERGSLISVTSTIRTPSPDLWVLLTSSPHGVSGAGVPLAPRAPIPPRAGSQSPVSSRRGAGPSGSTSFGMAVNPVLFQGCHFAWDSGTAGDPAGGPCGLA